MLKRIAIALGLLVGSFLAAWGASTTLSGLSAGAPISNTDLFYDVQTPGVGGVKVTGAQFLTFVFGKVSGSCTANGTGLFNCTSFPTATITSITGSLQCLQINTSGVVSGTGSSCSSGGGGTPGGASSQIQFNNAGAFGGDVGFTYTTPAAVVLTSGILTANVKALSISQTWNNGAVIFDAPLFINITNTASASNSLLADLKIGGVTRTGFRNDGATTWFDSSGNALFQPYTGGGLTGGNQFSVASGANIGFNANTSIANANDLGLGRDGVGELSVFSVVSNSFSPAGIHVYNSADSPYSPGTYSRGVFDWNATANSLTIGTQQNSGAGGQNVLIVSSNTRAQTISSTSTTFAAAINAPAIAQLGANTTGYACWTTGTGAISEDSTTCIASLRRLKKDITPFTDTTAELMALKPSQFQWKNPADANQRGQQLGFVAEDVHDVDSRLASYTGDGTLHGWRQDAMIAALVRGFQEQQAVIREQQTQIDDLKRRLH